MEFLLCFALANLFWTGIGRPLYIAFRYGKETGFPVPKGLTREKLMLILQRRLNYPGLKEIYYNERGQITIASTYGTHILRLNPMRLVVEKGRGRKAEYIEEAECLKAYIQKIFDPDAPLNPSEMYQKCKRTSRQEKFMRWGSLVISLIMVAVMLMNTGGVPGFEISTAYLEDYSSTVTIGEAFQNFFSDPQWTYYENGAQELVDFRGGCSYGGEPATMIITFSVNNETASIQKILIDGEEISKLLWHDILTVIYSEGVEVNYLSEQEVFDIPVTLHEKEEILFETEAKETATAVEFIPSQVPTKPVPQAAETESSTISITVSVKTSGGENPPPLSLNVSTDILLVLTGMNPSGFFITLPIQMLSTTVAVSHKFPFHSHLASRTTVVAGFSMTGSKDNQFCYRHSLTVAGKENQHTQDCFR